MRKFKEKYESAELEIVLLASCDIVTLSGEDDQEQDEVLAVPGFGNWDDGGWN